MSAETISPKQVGMDTPMDKSQALPKSRIVFIDNLRVLLVILVVLHHVAIIFGAEGNWYYYENQADDIASGILTLFVAINQSYFMGFYFLIAGYFTVPALDRKGSKRFLQDRLLRLGVPLIFYIFVINPLLRYVLAVNVEGYAGSLGHYVTGNLPFASGSLWFLHTLLIFTLIYVSGRHWLKNSAEPTKHKQGLPSNIAIAAYALIAGVLTFIVRLAYPVGVYSGLLGMQPAFGVQYISLFAFGLLAYRRGWLPQPSEGKIWPPIAVVLVALAPVIFMLGKMSGGVDAFMGGWNWQAFVYAVVEQFLCVSLIVTLLVTFSRHFNRRNNLLKTLAASAYTAYIIYAPVLLLIVLPLRGLHLDPLAKFALISVICVPLCFLIAHYLRKLPLAREIL
ncbi:MAG: acyltransferase family protein [Anaerolineae bacterium]|nr:acyltransferase family protein [Anaerolineae bacterium]